MAAIRYLAYVTKNTLKNSFKESLIDYCEKEQYNSLYLIPDNYPYLCNYSTCMSESIIRKEYIIDLSQGIGKIEATIKRQQKQQTKKPFKMV